MIVFEVLYVQVAALVPVAIFGSVFAISVGMVVWYLRGLKE
jgi:hypothetical protein